MADDVLKSMEVSQALPDQEQAIAQLLRFTFRQSDTFLSPAFLRWKFFSPRPGYAVRRSYVVVKGEQVQAHGCEWPLSFETPSGEVHSCHIVDLAARPEAKGTGVLIARHLMARNETVLTIGAARRPADCSLNWDFSRMACWRTMQWWRGRGVSTRLAPDACRRARSHDWPAIPFGAFEGHRILLLNGRAS